MEVDINDILFLVEVVTQPPLVDDKEYIQKNTIYNSVLDKYITESNVNHNIRLKKISNIWYIIQTWESKGDSIEINKIEYLDPTSFTSLDIKDKINILDVILKESLEIEAYEEAAIIRDKIETIKNG